jgi:hypothetical protein
MKSSAEAMLPAECLRGLDEGGSDVQMMSRFCAQGNSAALSMAPYFSDCEKLCRCAMHDVGSASPIINAEAGSRGEGARAEAPLDAHVIVRCNLTCHPFMRDGWPKMQENYLEDHGQKSDMQRRLMLSL